jgi:hypothetical protein
MDGCRAAEKDAFTADTSRMRDFPGFPVLSGRSIRHIRWF